jgi:trehalose 6-phosphate phosphatase
LTSGPDGIAPLRRGDGTALAGIRGVADAAGIFLDFDGTLSDIVARPELALPVEGAIPLLNRLASVYRLVAVITGRPGEDVRRLLPVPAVEVFGLYGLESAPRMDAEVREAREEVESIAATVPGSWVEDKGRSLAVHYRGASDPARAEPALRRALRPVAQRRGLTILPGKRVLELAPKEVPGKGAVVRREARSRRLRACLYAGDDLADLQAFEALDELRGRGLHTVKVAVASAETPEAVTGAADVVVPGPAGLLALLGRLETS